MRHLLTILFVLFTSIAEAQTVTMYICWDPIGSGTAEYPVAAQTVNVYRNDVRLWALPSNEICSPLPQDYKTTDKIGVSTSAIVDNVRYESNIVLASGGSAPPPQPNMPSPDGTTITAPDGALIAGDGTTWGWGTNAGLPVGNWFATREGLNTGGGGSLLRTCNGGQVYIKGDDAVPTWYQYTAGTFMQVGAEPCPGVPVPVGPTAKLTVSPTTVQLGTPVTFSTSGSIAGTSGITSWTLNFGDGTSQTGTNLPPLTLGKTYTTTGSYTSTLKLTDANSLTATNSAMIVTVTSAPQPPDPCVTTPLHFTVNRWPAGATGSRRLDYSSDRPVQISLDMRVTPWVLVATDARNCTFRQTH